LPPPDRMVPSATPVTLVSAWLLTTSPLGRKKLVPARRSMSCRMPAASSGGKASSSRNAVTNCDHTKKGRRMNPSPFARSWMVVVMVLIDPSSDEVMRKIIPTSQIVWPGRMSASGG